MADETTEGADPPAKEQTYDQEFFLALAAKGKDEWNKWRHDPANKYKTVTFAGVDFSQALGKRINFSGFEFGDHANFSKCKWPFEDRGDTVFLPCPARFSDATFGEFATFKNANFGFGAELDRVTLVLGPASTTRVLMTGPVSTAQCSAI